MQDMVLLPGDVPVALPVAPATKADGDRSATPTTSAEAASAAASAALPDLDDRDMGERTIPRSSACNTPVGAEMYLLEKAEAAEAPKAGTLALLTGMAAKTAAVSSTRAAAAASLAAMGLADNDKEYEKRKGCGCFPWFLRGRRPDPRATAPAPAPSRKRPRAVCARGVSLEFIDALIASVPEAVRASKTLTVHDLVYGREGKPAALEVWCVRARTLPLTSSLVESFVVAAKLAAAAAPGAGASESSDSRPLSPTCPDRMSESLCDAKGRAYFGPVTDYVSHVWQTPLHQFRAALAALPPLPGTDKRYFYVDALAVSQHGSTAAARAKRTRDLASFGDVIGQAKRTVLLWYPWDRPLALYNVRCLYELFLSLWAENGLMLAMTEAGLEAMRGEHGPEARLAIESIRSVDAGASTWDDWSRIHGLIESQLGDDGEPISFKFFNDSTGRGVCHGSSMGHARLDEMLREVVAQLLDDCGVPVADESAARELHGHEQHVSGVVPVLKKGDAAGYHLASCSWDATVRTWDLETGAQLAALRGHTDSVLAMCALGDDLLASGSADSTVRVWDLEQQKEVRCLQGHRDAVLALAVLSTTPAVKEARPSNDVLASASKDKTVNVWSIATGAKRASLTGHTAPVLTVAAANATLLASGAQDGNVRVWDWAKAQQVWSLDHSWHDAAAVYSLAVLGTTVLASGSADTTIRLWDLPTGKPLLRVEGHTAAVRSLASAGGLLVSGSDDGSVRVWDAASGKVRRVLSGDGEARVSSVAVAGDGLDQDAVIIAGSGDNVVRVWEHVLAPEEFVA